MKGKSLFLVGLLAAAVGVALLLFYPRISRAGIVITGGVLFVAVGLLNLIIFGQSAKSSKGFSRFFDEISNAGAIVLGICMLVFKDTFANLITFIFGLLIAVCALWQFFVLAIGSRPHQLPGWLYAFPLLLSALAVYIFLQKTITDSHLMLATGVGASILGLACICQGIALGIKNRASKAAAESHTPELDNATDATNIETAKTANDEQKSAETTENLDSPVSENLKK